MDVPVTPIPEQPALIDVVISEAQVAIKTKLAWLTRSFGRAQRLAELRDGKNVQYPAVHIGNGVYINVSPDQNLGNFSFFVAEDPQNIDAKSLNSCDVTAKVSLVFWFDLSTIFLGAKDRNTEALKYQILKTLTELHLKTGRLTVLKVYEQVENVYKGYTLTETATQFMMQPFGAFRFECEIKFVQSLC